MNGGFLTAGLRAYGFALAAVLFVAGVCVAPAADAPPREVVLIAGPASHGFGEHEHFAGLKLLGDLINEHVTTVHATVCKGWPADQQVLSNAAAIVLCADGGPDGLLVGLLPRLEPLVARGAGVGILHWTLDVPKGEAGNRLIDWIGATYETNWSVNLSWKADFQSLPEHPVTRGVRPFALPDEWYCHMRFRGDMKGVAPLLTAVPPAAVHEGEDGPHSGNPVMRARKGQPEHVSWAFERAGGGRGFGFSGGHKQWNWAHDDFRKLVLNAIVWLAGAEVPAGGVETPRPDIKRLLLNFEKTVPSRINFDRFNQMLNDLNSGTRTNTVAPAATSGAL